MSSHAQDLISPGVGGEAAFEPPEELDGRGAPPARPGRDPGQVYLAEDPVRTRPVAIQLIGADPAPRRASGS